MHATFLYAPVLTVRIKSSLRWKDVPPFGSDGLLLIEGGVGTWKILAGSLPRARARVAAALRLRLSAPNPCTRRLKPRLLLTSSTANEREQTIANQPKETLRDGRLKAAIRKNEGEKGAFFSVTLTRTYKEDAGNFHDSDSFSGSELLRIARLATRAYDRSSELREAERRKAS